MSVSIPNSLSRKALGAMTPQSPLLMVLRLERNPSSARSITRREAWLVESSKSLEFDTNFLKLLQLREKHWEIAYILRKSWAERTDQEKENMSRMLKRLEIDLLTSADVVFTTTVTLKSKFTRW